MKAVRKLSIKNWSGYFFKKMINILDIEPEYFIINDFKGRKDDSAVFNIRYSEEDCVPHVIFNNIDCIFRKRGVYSYLVFCESDKNKKMLDNYDSIADHLKTETMLFDEFEDNLVLGSCFMGFRFKTDDNLVYNTKINIPVCVVSISIIIK